MVATAKVVAAGGSQSLAAAEALVQTSEGVFALLQDRKALAVVLEAIRGLSSPDALLALRILTRVVSVHDVYTSPELTKTITPAVASTVRTCLTASPPCPETFAKALLIVRKAAAAEFDGRQHGGLGTQSTAPLLAAYGGIGGFQYKLSYKFHKQSPC
jgi:hypothetical protein